MGIFCAIVEMPAALLTAGISNLFHSRAIRLAPVSYDDPGIAIPFHGFSHEFQCGSLVPNFRNEGLQNFALMVNGTPQIVSLPTDLYKDFVQVPLPLRRLSHSFRTTLPYLLGKVSAKAVHPVTNRFMADIDAAFMEQIFNIPQ